LEGKNLSIAGPSTAAIFSKVIPLPLLREKENPPPISSK
jgi:hypothetical protein